MDEVIVVPLTEDGSAVMRVPTHAEVLVRDEFGRVQLQSGAWVLPVVERDGDWVERECDPADPPRIEVVEIDPDDYVQRRMTSRLREVLARGGDGSRSNEPR